MSKYFKNYLKKKNVFVHNFVLQKIKKIKKSMYFNYMILLSHFLRSKHRSKQKYISLKS